MRIPRDFDRWMFDYKEGNLSRSENSYFENYMSENPQLNSDAEAWNNSYVRKQNISYPGISTLQKENKLKVYSSWAAILILAITSSFGSYNYLKESIINLYSIRQVKLNFETTRINTPFIINRTKPESESENLIKTEKASLTNLNSTEFPEITTNSTYIIKNNFTKNTNFQTLIELEVNKINNSENFNSKKNSAHYVNNPTFRQGTKKSTNSKFNRKYKKSFLRTIKRGLRKIEKISGYPIGLINIKDPEFLTPTANLFNINPGFVGGSGTTRFDSRFRTQWLGSENNLQTSVLNFDAYIKSIRGGIGVSLNSENFNNGLLTDNKVNLIYSPKFAISSKLIFEPAVKLSLGLMTLDQSKINIDNTLEIQRGQLIKTFHSNDILTANNLWYKDYGLGFVLNSEVFYFGFNADNLAKHKQSIYGKNNHTKINYTAILGMDYQSKNKNMILSPFITYQNNSFKNELWTGVNFKYHLLTLGGGYSTKNDFSASLGIKTSNFKLLYQYDMTTSMLSSQKMGSHSIGLRINTTRKQ